MGNAIQAKCIKKFRDRNDRIIGYRLIDINRNTTDVKPNVLKFYIKTGKINVINLKLTSDYKLVDNNTNQNDIQKSRKDNTAVSYDVVKQYVPNFIAYIVKELHMIGISDSSILTNREEIYSDYIGVEQYIFLDNIRYNGRDISITVMFLINEICIDICYSDNFDEIDKTPRLRDKIDWKTISSSNKITISKLISCLKTL